MKKGNKLFVRIDYEIVSVNDISSEDAQIYLQEHLDYLNNVAKERYFIAGGFTNASGGMLIFEAENLEEAHKIANNDPLIIKGLFRCDLFEWTLEIISEHRTLDHPIIY